MHWRPDLGYLCPFVDVDKELKKVRKVHIPDFLPEGCGGCLRVPVAAAGPLGTVAAVSVPQTDKHLPFFFSYIIYFSVSCSSPSSRF